MGKGRLEAFSDGVLAVIITIMVLELKRPEGASLEALRPILPVFLAYVLSFLILAIYWNNHHHLMHAVEHVTGGVLWANMHLLFWLSLVPVTTDWMGDHHRDPWPVAIYAAVFLGAAIAYFFLTRALLAHHGTDSVLARALGSDKKGKLSGLAYAAAIPLAFVDTYISLGIIFVIALVWLVPDRRFERLLAGGSHSHRGAAS